MTALIIANGLLPSRSIIRDILKRTEIIICADGGANSARKLKILPDIIIGDFDSITSATKRYYTDVPQLHIEDQNSTDLEKSIIYCIKNDIHTAYIIGATGNRLDHTTGSLACYRKFRGQINLYFVDEVATLSRIHSSLTFDAEPGEKLSLIPLGRCTGVTTKNLHYALNNGILELGVQEGISNFSKGAHASVSVKRGILLLYRFHRKGKLRF